jgi:hypothetical protein
MTSLLCAKNEGFINVIQIMEEHFCKKNNVGKPGEEEVSEVIKIFSYENSNTPTLTGTLGRVGSGIISPKELEEDTCCLCWENPKNVVLLWCGHVCCC